MKLRNRKLEKSLRRRVRARLRQSPEDWAMYKRYRWSSWRERNIPGWVGRLLAASLFAGVLGGNFRAMKAFVGISVAWVIVTMATRAGQLLVALRASPRLPALAHLPVSNDQAFTIVWQTYLKNSALSVIDFTVIYLVLAMRAGFGGSSFVGALGLALLQWLGVVAMAVCLVAYVPRYRFRIAGWMLSIAIVLLMVGGRSVQGVIEGVAGVGFWVPSTGWIMDVLGLGGVTVGLAQMWPAISMGALFILMPLAYRRLRNSFVIPELAPDAEGVRGMVEAARRSEFDGTEPDPYAGLKTAIRGRAFLNGLDWQRAGFVERFVSRWLTPQQRLIADFLCAGRPQWTKRFFRASLVLCGVAALVIFVPRIVQMVMPFIIGLGVMGMNHMQRGWPGMSLRQVSGSVSCMCVVYPMSFRQIAGTIIRINLVQMLLSLPLLAIIGMGMALANGMGPIPGAIVVSKVFVIIALLCILGPVALISPGTNDTRSFLALIVAACGIFVILAAGIMFFAADWPLSGIAGLVLVLGSLGALKLYQHACDNGWFDLQRKPDAKVSVPQQQ